MRTIRFADTGHEIESSFSNTTKVAEIAAVEFGRVVEIVEEPLDPVRSLQIRRDAERACAEVDDSLFEQCADISRREAAKFGGEA